MLKRFIPAAFVAALAMPAMPAMAQDTGDPLAPPPVAEEAMQGALSPEQQAQYDLWPPEVQAYHDTLSPPRQEMFWRMNDQDKVSLANMSPMEQEQVWTAIETPPAQGPAETEDMPAGDPAG